MSEDRSRFKAAERTSRSSDGSGLLSLRRILVTIAAFSLMALPSDAFGDEFSFSYGGGLYLPGSDSARIDINFSNTEPRQGAQLAISYDPAVLSVDSIFAMGRIAAPLDLQFSDFNDGVIRLLVFDETAARTGIPSGTGAIGRIIFSVNLEAENPYLTQLSFLGGIVADSALAPESTLFFHSFVIDSRTSVGSPALVAVEAEDGNVRIEWNPPSEMGLVFYVIYRDQGTPEDRVRITADPLVGPGPHTVTDNSPAVRAGGVFTYAVFVVQGDREFQVASFTIETGLIPTRFHVYQNVPNPFNPSTQVRFDLPNAERVSLRIYDVSGRLVRTLVDERMNKGRHSVPWDGTDSRGNSAASGLYFYKLTAGRNSAEKRMTLLK